MPEINVPLKYQLTEAEKVEISNLVLADLTEGVTLSDVSKREVVNEISSQFQSGELVATIGDADKREIVTEVLSELKAQSTDVQTLERITDIEEVISLPAIRPDASFAAVPVDILVPKAPIEISSEEDIDILKAQGKLVENQFYFIAED